MTLVNLYFPHDYNSRTNPKLKKLIRAHGMLGYGLYWAVSEDLYNNSNRLPLDYEGVSFDLRVSVDVVKDLIENFELFTIDRDSNTFSSDSVKRRMEARQEKTQKAKDSIAKRWEKLKNSTNVSESNNDSSTNVLPPNNDSNTRNKIKGNKIKGNKRNTLLSESVAQAPAPHTSENSQEGEQTPQAAVPTEEDTKWIAFQSFITTEANQVDKMNVPFNKDQYLKLRKDYPAQMIRDVLLAMQNKKGLTKEYTSAYLTARQWCKMRTDNPISGGNTAPVQQSSAQIEDIKKLQSQKS